jgi:hypothetical protein
MKEDLPIMLGSGKGEHTKGLILNLNSLPWGYECS